MIIINCDWCGRQFEVFPSEAGRRRTCSRECWAKRLRGRPRRRRPITERFWAKVDRRGPNDCWVWRGATVRGYGVLWMSERHRSIRAPRFAYSLLNGPIPPNMTVDHICANTLCVNPAHLELCSAGENSRRGLARQRDGKPCPRCGAAMTTENVGLLPGRWPRAFCASCVDHKRRRSA